LESPSPDSARLVWLPRFPHSRTRITIATRTKPATTLKLETERTFSRACRTASTIASMATTTSIASNPTTRTTFVPTKTATNRASGTLHPRPKRRSLHPRPKSQEGQRDHSGGRGALEESVQIGKAIVMALPRYPTFPGMHARSHQPQAAWRWLGRVSMRALAQGWLAGSSTASSPN
jgi:hypothetical protein